MVHFSRSRRLIGLAGWILLVLIAAALGGVASTHAGSFYDQLMRPPWAPPARVFGPVWSVLYFLMGLAAWLVWRAHGFRGARTALTLFLVQLAANALWTWLFFTWHEGALAFIEILVLWVLIGCTMAAFWRIRPLAGALLIPYLLWVTFAAVLAFDIWRRNPQLLG